MCNILSRCSTYDHIQPNQKSKVQAQIPKHNKSIKMIPVSQRFPLQCRDDCALRYGELVGHVLIYQSSVYYQADDWLLRAANIFRVAIIMQICFVDFLCCAFQCSNIFTSYMSNGLKNGKCSILFLFLHSNSMHV